MSILEESPRGLSFSEIEAPPLILVIDDDINLSGFLAHFLAAAGYRVITAPDGSQGVAHYLEETPDAVLVDLLMPVKDGIETILELRKWNPNARIVAMSGGGQIEGFHYLDIAVKLGANVALEKPIDTARLLAVLRALLRSPRHSAAHRADRPFERWAEVRAHAALAGTRRRL